MCHEGGYSPFYVPFCGLATLETLAGIRTEVVDPLAAGRLTDPWQQVQPHQAAAIERAAANVARITPA